MDEEVGVLVLRLCADRVRRVLRLRCLVFAGVEQRPRQPPSAHGEPAHPRQQQQQQQRGDWQCPARASEDLRSERRARQLQPHESSRPGREGSVCQDPDAPVVRETASERPREPEEVAGGGEQCAVDGSLSGRMQHRVVISRMRMVLIRNRGRMDSHMLTI